MSSAEDTKNVVPDITETGDNLKLDNSVKDPCIFGRIFLTPLRLIYESKECTVDNLVEDSAVGDETVSNEEEKAKDEEEGQGREKRERESEGKSEISLKIWTELDFEGTFQNKDKWKIADGLASIDRSQQLPGAYMFEKSSMKVEHSSLNERTITELANVTLRFKIYVGKDGSEQDKGDDNSDSTTSKLQSIGGFCVGIASIPALSILCDTDNSNVSLPVKRYNYSQPRESDDTFKDEDAKTKKPNSTQKKNSDTQHSKSKKAKKKTPATKKTSDDSRTAPGNESSLLKDPLFLETKRRIVSSSLCVHVTVSDQTKTFVANGSLCTLSGVELSGKCLDDAFVGNAAPPTPPRFFELRSLSPANTDDSDFNLKWSLNNAVNAGDEDEDDVSMPHCVRWRDRCTMFLSAPSISSVKSLDDALVKWRWTAATTDVDGNRIETIGDVDILDVLEPGRVRVDAKGASGSVQLQLCLKLSRSLVPKQEETETPLQRFRRTVVPSQTLVARSESVDSSKRFEREVRNALKSVLATAKSIQNHKSGNAISTKELRQRAMYLLNVSGNYVGFRDSLKKAVVRLAREELERIGTDTEQYKREATDSTFLASLYRNCAIRCNRIVRKMVDEVGGSSSSSSSELGEDVDSKRKKEDATSLRGAYETRANAVPLIKFIARNRAQAREAEYFGNDVKRAASLYSSRVERVELEFASDASELSRKTAHLVDALCERSGFYLRAEKYDGAYESLKRVCALESNNAHNFAIFGCALMRAERFDDALSAFECGERLLRNSVDNPSESFPEHMRFVALMEIAWTQGKRSNPFRHSFWPRLSRGGGRAQGHARADAAAFLLDCRLFEIADSALGDARRVAMTGFPCIVRSLANKLNLCKGRLAARNNRLKDAISYFQEALETADGARLRCEALAALGNAFYALGDRIKATRCYEICLEEQAFDSNIELYVRLGELYTDSARFRDAKQVFLRGCMKYPCASMWCGVGVACYRMGELLESERAFAESNLLSNENPAVWLYLALLSARRAGRFELAWKAINEACKLDMSECPVAVPLLMELCDVLFDAREMDLAKCVCCLLLKTESLPSNESVLAKIRFRVAEILENQDFKRDALLAYEGLFDSTDLAISSRAKAASIRVKGSLS